MNVKKIRIGSGAGYSGDRIEPAIELAEKGGIQYLIFECLAERTIALAQQQKARDASRGFDPMLEERMTRCLPACAKNKIRIITNMGAANPIAAAEKTLEVAKKLGISGLKIAAVTGDDVFELVKNKEFELLETAQPLNTIRQHLISANAYLGAGPIVEALRQGADIVITGRVADPALFMAPLIHEFGWSFDDYPLLGKGTLLGHLLECAGQVTGGYFADPGYKDVPDLHRLGFPIAEVDASGDFFITKVLDSGGQVTPATCKEQLLYEIHDPANYLTPDVIADFTQVTFTALEKDQVMVRGGTGKAPTGLYKVSLGYQDGYLGEGQISYGGPGAVTRGELALEIVRKRLQDLDLPLEETRFELIGVNSLYGNASLQGTPSEVRVRVAARCVDRFQTQQIGREVETLYTNGPAGGGGVTRSVREVIAIQSILLDAKLVKPFIHYKIS